MDSHLAKIDNNFIPSELKEISEIDDGVNKRRRKKSNYKKINNQTRQKLIEMVKIFLFTKKNLFFNTE